VKEGWRPRKRNGYKTCVFDIGIFNYIGMCECIKDDFKYFLDDKYLILKDEPFEMKRILGDNQTQNQKWIYNTYYNFAFNHESPGHGRLWESEKWPGGINHFVNNKFEKFKERFSKRINNFRNYLKSTDHITFGIIRYNDDCSKLINILKTKYPDLKFTICCYTDVKLFKGLTRKCRENPDKSEEGILEFNTEYLKYLNITEEKYPEEWYRYKIPLRKFADSEFIIFRY
tara:strand:+ start:9194 stop:9880 length:687 start_codon:yes stop_codon:yes gene_type:complete